MVSIKRPIPNIKIHIQDRDLGSIIKKLKILAKKVEIDKPIEEKAVRICKEAVHKKLDFSFSEKAFIGGIIYTTTHTVASEGLRPTTLDEIADLLNVGKNEIFKVHYLLCRELGLKGILRPHGHHR